MEIGKAFTYIFSDNRWLPKLTIGWLVSLVPILNFAFTGYTTETIRNVELRKDDPLPEWDDFGKKFLLGFYMWLAGIVYALPVILLSFLFVFPIIVASDGEVSDTLASVMIGTTALFSCITVIYVLALSFFLPAANINLARKGTIGSVFEIGEFFRIFRANPGDYLIAWVMTLVWAIVIGVVAGILISFLTVIICIGWIIAFFIGALVGVVIPLVYAHLFGQVAARQATPA